MLNLNEKNTSAQFQAEVLEHATRSDDVPPKQKHARFHEVCRELEKLQSRQSMLKLVGALIVVLMTIDLGVIGAVILLLSDSDKTHRPSVMTAVWTEVVAVVIAIACVVAAILLKGRQHELYERIGSLRMARAAYRPDPSETQPSTS